MMSSNSTFAWAHRNFPPWLKPSLRISEARRNLPYHWNREAAAGGRRERVYCGLLCDPFDPAAPEAWGLELWSLITNTTNLDWTLVTDHLDKAEKFLRSMYASPQAPSAGVGAADPGPLPNLSIGAYVQDQAEAEALIPALARIPAVAHSIHCEPLLGPLDLSSIDAAGMAAVDLVICDVQQAVTAHPFCQDWAMELQAQCFLRGVDFYSRHLPSLASESLQESLPVEEQAEVTL